MNVLVLFLFVFFWPHFTPWIILSYWNLSWWFLWDLYLPNPHPNSQKQATASQHAHTHARTHSHQPASKRGNLAPECTSGLSGVNLVGSLITLLCLLWEIGVLSNTSTSTSSSLSLLSHSEHCLCQTKWICKITVVRFVRLKFSGILTRMKWKHDKRLEMVSLP